MARPVQAFVFSLVIYALLCPPIAAAPPDIEQRVGGLTLSPTAGGLSYKGTDSRSLNPLFGVKIGYDIIGKSFEDSLGLEGTLNYFRPDSKSGGSGTSGYIGRVDALYYIMMSKKVVPYLVAGAGAIVTSGDATSKGIPLVNYGVGLKYFLWESLALRADARHILTYVNTNIGNNFELSLGLCYYFDKKIPKKVVPLPEKKPPGKETSATDTSPLLLPLPVPLLGSEPAEPPGPVPVKQPAKAPAQLESLEVQQPAPTTVDHEAQPPASTKAGHGGRSRASRLTIEFDSGEYDVKPHYRRQIEESARTLRSSPAAKALIEGHADSTGSRRYNFALSQKRAQSVKNLLVKFGIDPNRVAIKWFGSSRPVATNESTEGRQRNRRAVEIVIVKH